MKLEQLFITIQREISQVLERMETRELDTLRHALREAERVFVVGEGRSGHIAKMFAMRLAQMGLSVFVIGETNTPRIGQGDLFLGVSGSGETPRTIASSRSAKSNGAHIFGITANPESSLGQLADCVVCVPGATKREGSLEVESIQPLSSLFDQSLHLVLDSLCLQLAMDFGLGQEALKAGHTNV